MNTIYRDKLIKMQEKDLIVQEELLKRGELSSGYNPIMRRTHNENTKVLKELIDEYGFPTKTCVGEDGHDAAWMIIQHSIEDRQFMSRMYKEMSKLSEKEVNPIKLGYLEDRLNFYVRKPQVYGSQFDYDLDGNFGPWELIDKERVNELRKDIGLGALEDSIDSLSKVFNPISKEEARDERIHFENWLVELGWIGEDKRTIK